MERRAKIVCTIGPASIREDILFSLIEAGMDVARLNFSHGDYEFHRRAIDLVRKGSKRFNRPVSVLQDLQGIKIRVGTFKKGSTTLKKGSEVSLLSGLGVGDEGVIYISYPRLLKDIRVGDRVLLDDGLIELRVRGRGPSSLRAEVIEGGTLRDKKGVNFPDSKIILSALTLKDRKDLLFGLEMGVDYVAVSFVREAEDIEKTRRWLKRQGASLPLIAKIEKPEAIKNISEIIDASDGIMVARGDLGVELPPEEVPLLQKMLIERANSKGKLVITATQMLESMTQHTRPTRAEATDVANAVIDGTDALMLSAETSTGSYPLLALKMMDRIIKSTEAGREAVSQYRGGKSFSEAVAEAASGAAKDIGATYITAFTQSGYTARLLSKYRPSVPILGFTTDERIMRRMSLYWGVIPKLIRPLRSTDALFMEIERTILKEGLAKKGQSIVITASTPILGSGKTNLLKLHRLGFRINGGQ